MKTLNDYEKQALYFAKKYGVKLQILGSEYKTFWSEEQKRWVFKCKLSRNSKSYNFEFGQSIANGSNEPAMYDILSCLTKYDPETFENFCAEFGYDINSRDSKKTYRSVCKEYEAVKRLFGDIMDELQEIQ